MSAPMRLVLVRHGETVGHSSIRYYGRTDVALSDLGRRQMRAAREWLAARDGASGFAPVFTSPLVRATEAARGARISMFRTGTTPSHRGHQPSLHRTALSMWRSSRCPMASSATLRSFTWTEAQMAESRGVLTSSLEVGRLSRLALPMKRATSL